MKVFENYLREYAEKFNLSRCDIEEIVSFACGCEKQNLITLSEAKFLDKENLVLNYLKKIKSGMPIEYVLGYKDFYSLRLNVTQDVLIPRHETEILVDKIVKRYKNTSKFTLFDVCCGSGAVGLSLKKVFEQADVYLSDISTSALRVAKDNAQTNDLEVNFLQGDLLKPFKNLKADLFVCNPPYVSDIEYEELSKGVRDYEPKLALLAQNNGFEFYQRLCSDLPYYLNSGALIAFEIGYNQKKILNSLFSKKPYHKLIFEKDFSGLDRFFFLEIE